MTRKKYVDKRNWKEYNEKLVRRGEQCCSIKIIYEDSKSVDATSQEAKTIKAAI
jgi:hypothetical protein